MNVVVAGLSPRDEAAFGFFLSRSMKGWSWESTPAGRGTVLPKADLLLADLVSLGLVQPSARDLLTYIREYNPLLFDFALKRSLRWNGRQFPPAVFETRPFFEPRPA